MSTLIILRLDTETKLFDEDIWQLSEAKLRLSAIQES